MEEIVLRFLDSTIGRILLTAVLTALITVLLSELTRGWRQRRQLIESAELPQFVLSIKEGDVTIRMFGNYGILNISELPITLSRPHLLGYNFASRAFQFKVAPTHRPSEKLFEDLSIPPKSEKVLISDKFCEVRIERYCVRWIPTFLWLETLEHIRLGYRRRFRWRSRLYVQKFYPAEEREVWYRPTKIEVGSQKARLLALPGKFLFRRRERQALRSGAARRG